MIKLSTSWFKIVELQVSQLPELDIPMYTKRKGGKDTHIQLKQAYVKKLTTTVDV